MEYVQISFLCLILSTNSGTYIRFQPVCKLICVPMGNVDITVGGIVDAGARVTDPS